MSLSAPFFESPFSLLDNSQFLISNNTELIMHCNLLSHIFKKIPTSSGNPIRYWAELAGPGSGSKACGLDIDMLLEFT